MKVLLTGANGHVGANTARALLKRGHEVVAFVRASSDLRGLEGLDVAYAHGDVTDGSALAAAAQGCDAIVHTAAIYRYWSKNPAEIEAVTLEGAQNIVAAAAAAGVKRLVYTSSSWAIGLADTPDRPRTAADWNEQPHTPYARAKTFGERKAWELANQAGVPMVALCPGAIMGALDYRITPSNRILLGMADGSGQSFDSGLALADARDVGAIHALAVDHGAPGMRYAITQNITFKELGAQVTALTGRPVKHFGAPKPIARLVAGIMELGAAFTGKEPALTRALIDDAAGRYMYIDSTATWQAFGHPPYPIAETVRASLQWYVTLGLLPPDSIKR